MSAAADSILDLIDSGEIDDDLRGVIAACLERERFLGAKLFADLKIGDKVRVRADANLKPRYLNGALGSVVDKRLTKVTVRFDDDIHDPYGKWAGKRAICSPTTIERVS